MAVIPYTNPFRMEDATLKLGTDQYEALVSSAAITPAKSSSEFRAINGDVRKRAGKSSFTLDLDFGQDTKTANSLAIYLYDHAGERVAFQLKPQAGGSTFDGFVYLVEGGIGGATNTDATATVQLECDGKPVRTPAA